MRISTSTMYDQGITSVQNQQSDLFNLQQQIASGRRILNPADDPINAARALQTTQSINVNQQYQTNVSNAKSQLNVEEGVLSQIMNVIQQAKQLTVQAGNPTVGAANYVSMATDVQNLYNQLLGLANQTDGNGQYLFSGFKGSTQPFTQTSGPGVYAGDQGQRRLQVGPSRYIETSDDGQSVFQPGVAGKDLFKTLDDLKNALASGAPTTASLNQALNELDSERVNISTVTASVGSRLRELDSVDTSTSGLILNYQQALSDQQDLDYSKAISDLTKKQFNLQAAQQSYIKITGLSLFNYLS